MELERDREYYNDRLSKARVTIYSIQLKLKAQQD